MSLRLRVVKLYQWFDREGAWPYEPNTGEGATRAATALVVVVFFVVVLVAAMCEN
jgi:hypothetical protein